MNRQILYAFFFMLVSKPSFAQNGGKNIKWKTLKIPVCWELSAQQYSTEKKWVKDAIDSSWAKESTLKFTGWCPCQKGMKGIHIGVEDSKEGARVKKLGANLDGLNDGIILNFTFTKWNSGLVEQLQTRKKAITAVAVHEFGHAIGFTHQQTRDNCYLCDSVHAMHYITKNNGIDKDEDNGLWPTPCDQFSVMNYCNSMYANYGKLSQTDIEAVRFIYGDKQAPDIPNYISISHEVKPLNKIQTADGESHAGQGGQGSVPSLRGYYLVNKYKYYQVNLRVKADKKILDNIRSVSYWVDASTYQSPQFLTKNPRTNFLLSLEVWGSFTVMAIITFKDQTPPLEIEVPLAKVPPFQIIQSRSPYQNPDKKIIINQRVKGGNN